MTREELEARIAELEAERDALSNGFAAMSDAAVEYEREVNSALERIAELEARAAELDARVGHLGYKLIVESRVNAGFRRERDEARACAYTVADMGRAHPDCEVSEAEHRAAFDRALSWGKP
jgi:uncharacterized coiled-coil DUF342 family protein